ncbi:unnamed protein product [Darwinula stevensoni]|uniref:GDNF/GAS1 domain-containing protein n=1 Tax=Darwinula stevensoni TaxID=69355 RepID=A0A7R8X5F8_9CRUS|nr:unnamed protein product [Darwinula stevensoni]CAG0887054.1 unnamed protein product [Darwinula stevensoni]
MYPPEREEEQEEEDDEGGSGKEVSLSTCGAALDECKRDHSCNVALAAFRSYCFTFSCSPDSCRSSVANLYRRISASRALDIAFCVCREGDEECEKAQDELHPTCALSEGPGRVSPLCNHVARDCKDDPQCRGILESFEQSCAVDSDTLECAGSREACRDAVIGTLGTEIRRECQCPMATNPPVPDLYSCLGWQRLLWLNPCVNEAQQEYVLMKLKQSSGMIHPQEAKEPLKRKNHSLRPPPPPLPPPSRTNPPFILTTSPTNSPRISTTTTRKVMTTTITTTAATTTTTATTTTLPPRGLHDISRDCLVRSSNRCHSIDNSLFSIKSIKFSVAIPLKKRMADSSSRLNKYFFSQGFCLAKKGDGREYRIIEDKRPVSSRKFQLYEPSRPECSELCMCEYGQELSCKTLSCIEKVPCSTNVAKYVHSSPAYLAYRKECLCYSGDFICMRPDPGSSLSSSHCVSRQRLGPSSLTLSLVDVFRLREDASGVFLYLGYSRRDEALLLPQTRESMHDAIPRLESIIARHARNKSSCSLNIYNWTGDNVVLQARISDPPDSTNESLAYTILWREKTECSPALLSLKELINSRDVSVAQQPTLSMIKLADVEIKVVDPVVPSGASSLSDCSPLYFLVLIVLWTHLLNPT